MRPAADVLLPLIEGQARKQKGDDDHAAQQMPRRACQPQQRTRIVRKRTCDLWHHDESLHQHVWQSVLREMGCSCSRSLNPNPYVGAIALTEADGWRVPQSL
jgi:hypothetical protein